MLAIGQMAELAVMINPRFEAAGRDGPKWVESAIGELPPYAGR
jgi:hypothetical protein